MIILNPEKSVAVVGKIGTRKTTYLSELVKLLANSKSVCVIENSDKAIYGKILNLGLVEIASFNHNRIHLIRDSGAAVDFIHLPSPSRVQKNEGTRIFDVMLIHHMLAMYDAIIIDEAYHTMSEMIQSGMFTEFVDACNKKGVLLVFSGQKLFLDKMIPAGKQHLLDYILELELDVQFNGVRKTKLHDADLYYEKLQSFKLSPSSSAIGSAVGTVPAESNKEHFNSSHAIQSNGEEKEAKDIDSHDKFIMDSMKFIGELLIWASTQNKDTKVQSNSIIEKAVDEFEKMVDGQIANGDFDTLLECFKKQANFDSNSSVFQQFLKDLEQLFAS